jgi:hypothetical protein
MIVLFLYYTALRFLAYLVWCFGGLLLLHRGMRRRWLRAAAGAVALALVRLLLGLITGYIIFYQAVPRFMLPAMRLSEGLWGSYCALYLPVRFIEWLILAMIIIYLSKRATPSLVGGGERRSPMVSALCWIIGGVVLSCSLDLLMLGLEKNFTR